MNAGGRAGTVTARKGSGRQSPVAEPDARAPLRAWWLRAGDRAARDRALLTLLWRATRWRLPVVGVLAVLQGLAPTAAVVATGVLVDAVLEPAQGGPASAPTEQALLGLALFGGVLLSRVVVTTILDHQVVLLDSRYGHAVHETVAGATLRTRELSALEDPAVVGELTAIEEFERVDGFVSTVAHLRELVQRRTTGAGALVVLATFAWWAPLVMLVAWLGLSHGIRRWIEHGVGLSASISAKRMSRPRYLRSLAVDPPAAKEVRLFGLADWLVRDYVNSYRDVLREIWAGRRLGMRWVMAATGGVAVAHLLVLAAIAWQAHTGTLSGARLVVLVQAVLATSTLGAVGEANLAIGRARQVAWQALRLHRALCAPGRTTPSATVTSATAGAAPEPLEVRLTGVRFGYPSRSDPTLDGLDLHIPAGQSVAIVGANGAGKSTIIKILCGLYRPDRGQVDIGGAAPDDLPGRIGVVFQNFTRYELPLRENVGFGSPRFADDQPALAAALAEAGEDDLPRRLPHGWDTVLSSGYPDGCDLSGGQWQKVALARALTAVRGGAGLLVLDEPTAALDVRAEAELFDRFLAVTRGVTTILVSHRLASVCRADRIVVIADGRVREDGSHRELMAANGRYAEMFTLQAERFGSDTRDGPEWGRERADG